jgi:hypothetical protein
MTVIFLLRVVFRIFLNNKNSLSTYLYFYPQNLTSTCSLLIISVLIRQKMDKYCQCHSKCQRRSKNSMLMYRNVNLKTVSLKASGCTLTSSINIILFLHFCPFQLLAIKLTLNLSAMEMLELIFFLYKNT